MLTMTITMPTTTIKNEKNQIKIYINMLGCRLNMDLIWDQLKEIRGMLVVVMCIRKPMINEVLSIRIPWTRSLTMMVNATMSAITK